MKVLAVKIGVKPALIRGHEDQRLIYFTWADSPVVGAQCADYNTILWVDQRKDEISTEIKPDEIRESGSGYRKYAEEKILRFLGSMPDCTHCGKRSFDWFVNNVNYPRFSEVGELKESIASTDILKSDAENIEVTLLK